MPCLAFVRSNIEAHDLCLHAYGSAYQRVAVYCLLQALVDFEEVLGMEPPNYVGDDFSRVTQIYRVTQYNISCCYSAMDQVNSSCCFVPAEPGSEVHALHLCC